MNKTDRRLHNRFLRTQRKKENDQNARIAQMIDEMSKPKPKIIITIDEKHWFVVVNEVLELHEKTAFGKFSQVHALELQAMLSYGKRYGRALHFETVSQHTNHVVISEEKRKELEEAAAMYVWYEAKKELNVKNNAQAWRSVRKLADQIYIEDNDYVIGLLYDAISKVFPK